MITNPHREVYLRLGQDIARRKQVIGTLREEEKVLHDICKNKSVELINLRLICEIAAHDATNEEAKLADAHRRIDCAMWEEEGLDALLTDKLYLLDDLKTQQCVLMEELQLRGRSPAQVLSSWRRIRWREEQRQRRKVIAQIRICLRELEHVVKVSQQPTALATLGWRNHIFWISRRPVFRLVTAWGGRLERARATQTSNDYCWTQCENLCIRDLWAEDEMDGE